MAVLLDTATLPWGERADAVCAALATALAPASVSAPAGVRSRISRWDLGPGADLVQHVSDGHRLTRTGKHLRSDNPERISLGLPDTGSVRLTHRDTPRGDRIRELQLVDLTSPYDFHVAGPCTVQAVIVDYAQLGLSVDTVRAAIPRLPASPLYPMMRRHLRELPEVTDAMTPGPALAMLGSSTTELIRALITSTTAGPDESTLFARMTAYIRHHQKDQDLSAVRLAAEHAVSVRAVYAAFAEQGEYLAEWVMRGRLEGARGQLARTRPGPGSIARTAHAWGFKDARHFARRFRAAYGMSPGEWQQVSAAR